MNSYYIITFGCQMNTADSDKIGGKLKELGFIPALNEGTADLLILNACSVRQRSMDRVYGRAFVWKSWKEDRPRLVAILTGCLLKSDKKKLNDKFDFILDNKEITRRLPAIIKKQFNFKGSAHSHTTEHGSEKKVGKVVGEAIIPIMTGCDNFCSYCVVPYTRGREKSIAPKRIVQEIKNALQKGYKEILLVGQNVNSYKWGKINFTDLLKILDESIDDFLNQEGFKMGKIARFITNHPKDMSAAIPKFLASSKHFKHFIHLPLQSGSNKVLRAMNRKYVQAEYLGLIKKIKKYIPDVNLSTDVIVGFPGETKKDFADTVKVLRKVGFDTIYINKYSPRSSTVSFNFQDDVSAKEKLRREAILREMI